MDMQVFLVGLQMQSLLKISVFFIYRDWWMYESLTMKFSSWWLKMEWSPMISFVKGAKDCSIQKRKRYLSAFFLMVGCICWSLQIYWYTTVICKGSFVLYRLNLHHELDYFARADQEEFIHNKSIDALVTTSERTYSFYPYFAEHSTILARWELI